MAKFEWTVNTVTGNPETTFSGKFLGLTSELKTRQNAAGETKGYYLGNVEFENAAGERQVGTCRINEANYKYGMEVGKEYLCTAENTSTGIYIGMSHLQQVSRVTEDAFGFTGEVKQPENKLAEVGADEDF